MRKETERVRTKNDMRNNCGKREWRRRGEQSEGDKEK
jgi:hypothetical protein